MADHDTHDHTGVTGVPSATAPNPTTIELGHASDTTLARVSAGVVSIEGTNIVKAGAVTANGVTMATARLLGRTTASTGAIEEITVGSGLSLAAGALTATGGSGVADAHSCRVKRITTGFSVGNNVLTAIEFNSEDFDTDTMHDNSTAPSRLTIPSISGVTTGLWHITGSSYFDQTVADLVIRVDGTTNISFQRASNALGSCVTSADYVLAATQYVELLGRTPGGAGNAALDAQVSPWFSAVFVGKVS